MHGAEAGLAAARIQAEVTDQVTRRGEAVDPADRGHQRRRGCDIDAGDRHQPPDLRAADGVARDLTIDLGELAGEEVGLADAAEDRCALISWQVQAGQPLAAFAGKDVTCGAAATEAANQRRVNLVTRTGAPRTSCVRRAIWRRSTRVASSQTQTPGSIPAASSLAIIRASTRSFLTFACVIALTLRVSATKTPAT